MGGKRWSEEETEHFKQCLAEGKDEFQISGDFHVKTKMNVKGFHKRSPAAIKRRIHDLPEEEQPVDGNKPSMHKKSWAPEDDTMLLQCYSMGMNWDDIGDALERTGRAVENRYYFLKRLESESTFSMIVRKLSNFSNSLSKALFGSKNQEEGK